MLTRQSMRKSAHVEVTQQAADLDQQIGRFDTLFDLLDCVATDVNLQTEKKEEISKYLGRRNQPIARTPPN